ncbi:MAG: roadblock/LC7 domain-containing protein [Chloroflexi bacterium]|nr:roadblock/LC7 domain-containing protein [Chloroflexota bacterium]
MNATKSQRIDERLGALTERAPGVEAAAVISIEGLLIAASMPATLREDVLEAMSAAMLALGERIAADLDRGRLDQVYVKGEAGFVLLMAIDDYALLTTLAADEAKLGLVHLDMREAVADLKRLL